MQLIDWIGAIGGIGGVLVAIGALIVASRANARSSEANRIAQRALERESLVDERQREFRAVEWDARILNDQDDDPSFFELRNVVDIAAKEGAKLTSERFVTWMSEARENEIVHPAYRVQWSSPLGQVSDETIRGKTIDDFIDWSEGNY